MLTGYEKIKAILIGKDNHEVAKQMILNIIKNETASWPLESIESIITKRDGWPTG